MEIEKLPRPNATEFNGMLFPNFLTKERMAQIAEATIREDDIFVITYPKCGTTWTQELVWQILHDGEVSTYTARTTWTQELVWQILHDGEVSEAKINLRFPWYEAGPWQPDTNYFTPQSQAQVALDALPSPRRMKCHLPIHLMPLGISTRPCRCKCIYVMRNPKDAAVSHYHQVFSMKGMNYNGTWDQFLPLHMAGKVYYGCFYDHVLGWWSHRDDPNILFLKYEDMKKDLPSNVQKIARFLGKSLSDELVERIARQCKFQFMRENPATNMITEMDHRRKQNTSTFMRKGEVGDWKNYFTEKQNEEFDKQYAEKMKESGLEFQWE